MATGVPIVRTSDVGDALLREKQTHVEQLMREHELDQLEVVRLTQQLEAVFVNA
jgi:hypothetical protein